MDRMNVIYDLRDDRWRIEQVQRASLSKKPVGLKITHGLVATEEWWENIKQDRLPTHVVEGNINQLWIGRTGDYPEVEIADANGFCSRWLLPIERSVAQRDLKIGRAIEILYVQQELKKPFNGTGMTTFLLTVKVELPWAILS
ncbi:hypothetical protein [Dyella acidiphila]|uniref:Uncharacterized protein n=1 Tax=Dyella acidiphila TaxID=2775866 RepID=A0ABR9GCQ9_9GAMM|nr:hypothetical protein [Dyella acidiphila]MBE1161769.1 hypothetical protein [Dyella acidiphila]